MTPHLISFEDVSIGFDQTHLLRNIHLQIAAGESLVVIGPSGEGKSVILKMLAGLLLPSTGSIKVAGTDLYRSSEKERNKQILRMGMLFQKNALFDSLTVGENVGFPLREVRHLPEPEVDKKIDYFLDAVGLLPAKNLYPDEISGGMQKRLGIARALALNPEIILYDDPTAGLDPITSRKIVDLIIELKRQNNSTVIAITNDMNRAYQLADRIVLVCDGEVVITGNVEQTQHHVDPRVQQFISGALTGPLTRLA